MPDSVLNIIMVLVIAVIIFFAFFVLWRTRFRIIQNNHSQLYYVQQKELWGSEWRDYYDYVNNGRAIKSYTTYKQAEEALNKKIEDEQTEGIKVVTTASTDMFGTKIKKHIN